MAIFTGRGRGQAKPGRPGGLNLWRQWANNPKSLSWLLRDEDILQPIEVNEIEKWATREAEWSLNVRVHLGACGKPQIAEVLAFDEPHVLIYRAGNAIQVDSSQGESRLCADVVEALEFVRNYA